jgi:hypothetical protein
LVVFAYPESPNATSAGKPAGTLAGIEVYELAGEENLPGRSQRTLRPIRWFCSEDEAKAERFRKAFGC